MKVALCLQVVTDAKKRLLIITISLFIDLYSSVVVSNISMDEIKEEIENVEKGIAKVMMEIEEITRRLENETNEEKKKKLREEKRRLGEREKRLGEKERQLREEKLRLLSKDDAGNNTVLSFSLQ